MIIRKPCNHRLVLVSISLALFLVLSSTGCPVKFISNYDFVTDSALTGIQKKFEAFFAELDRCVNADETNGTASAAFSRHRVFYDDLMVDIRVLIRRKTRPTARHRLPFPATESSMTT